MSDRQEDLPARRDNEEVSRIVVDCGFRFAQDAPEIITGDDYEAKAGSLFDQLLRCKINIFNISKIDSEVRGGKSPKIKRLEVKSGFCNFELDVSTLKFPPISEELWVQLLRTGETEVIGVGKGGITEKRLEDYVVSGLVDFDDIAYEAHADLLYDLATQTVAYKTLATESPLDFKQSPKDKSNMSKYLFTGFKKCLYPVQKFDSEGERVLSVILEREAEKWFKPAKGQFQIYYKSGADHPEYQPDFVAETADAIYMLEPKASNKMNDPEVLAKKEAAEAWCKNASDYSAKHAGKPWVYALISHDSIAENMSIRVLGN